MKTISRPISQTVLALALALGAASAAAAHAKLVKADPPIGGVAQGQPGTLDLAFSEEISGKLSGAVVKDSAGAVVPSATMLDKGDKGLMVMLKTPLKAGDYKVDWHAVASDDGHKTTGSYGFTVK